MLMYLCLCKAFVPDGSIYILYVGLYAVEDAFCARMDACGSVVMDAVDDMFGARMDVCSSLVLGYIMPVKGELHL